MQIQYSDKRNWRRVPAITVEELQRIYASGDVILKSVRMADFGRGYVEECCEVSFGPVQYAPYVTEDGFVGLRRK